MHMNGKSGYSLENCMFLVNFWEYNLCMFIFERNRGEISSLIREHGLTPTSQRLDIGEVLLNKPQHLCADEVLSRVNAQSNKASKATVYNTLNSFLKHGLIQAVKVNHQHVIYDSVTEPHHHFYNEDTDVLTDIDGSEISVTGIPDLPKGLVNRGVDVLIRVGKNN